MIGTRSVKKKLASTTGNTSGNPPFSKWLSENSKVSLGTFEQAAVYGEIVINATQGAQSISALKLAGDRNLAGKILVDISNPLDFSKGMPPCLISELQNTNSLGEEIQKTFPLSKVVKTLITMWCGLMVNPELIGNGEHINFIVNKKP
jgi:8-hydroxy-5-deazaflavin:NADPH oxidoreductase